jgi:hypothetical protein
MSCPFAKVVMRRLVLLLALFVAPLHAMEPVALVTELAGKGTFGASTRTEPLELLQDLMPGARLTLAGGARAVVVHTASGVVYELTGPGAFRVQAKAVESADGKSRVARRELPAAIRAYKLNPAVAAQASVIMRASAPLRLAGPNGGVLSDDELRYGVPASLRDTRLEVLDETGTVVLRLDGADGFDLKGRHAWSPGHRYVVRVKGIDARSRAVTLEAAFQILPAETVARVRSMQPAAGTPATDWVVYALALESVGANASARDVWTTLQSR